MYCLFNAKKVWSNDLVYKETFGNNLKSPLPHFPLTNYLPPTNQNRPKMAISVNPGLMFVNIKLQITKFKVLYEDQC